MTAVAQENVKEGGVLGGTLLVVGTAIGAGALGLPVATGLGGFFPSIILYLIAWLLMAGTGLLFLEIALWMGPDANIVSMAGKMLGRGGKLFAWVVYLYLFYSLTVAYVSGSGQVVADLTNGAVPTWLGTVLFTLIFAPWIYVGAAAVDHTNVVMIVGLAIAYLAFVVLGAPHVQTHLLSRVDWGHSLYGLPLIIASFGYQGLVPSLTGYLKRNVAHLRVAIIVGSFITLLVYVVWEMLILGIVPVGGAHGLESTFAVGGTAVAPLRYALETPWVHAVGEFFAFFALTSSFLGVSLGLRDFLADGLGVKKSAKGRFWLCLLIFVPALLISWSNPRLFLLALRYGGGVGVALLLGILPVILVWAGRYQLKLEGRYRLMGGKPMLACLGIGFFVVLVVELIY